jgi:hypothetical protein
MTPSSINWFIICSEGLRSCHLTIIQFSHPYPCIISVRRQIPTKLSPSNARLNFHTIIMFVTVNIWIMNFCTVRALRFSQVPWMFYIIKEQKLHNFGTSVPHQYFKIVCHMAPASVPCQTFAGLLCWYHLWQAIKNSVVTSKNVISTPSFVEFHQIFKSW